MAEKDVLPLNSKSLLGRAMMLQTLSGIMIVGSLAVRIPPIDEEWIGLSLVGGLIVIGLSQILSMRAVLQKDSWGISASNTLSILAVLFSLVVGFFWIIQYTEILLGLYFIVVGMLNTESDFGFSPSFTAGQKKQSKVNKYLAYSVELGQVEPL